MSVSEPFAETAECRAAWRVEHRAPNSSVIERPGPG